MISALLALLSVAAAVGVVMSEHGGIRLLPAVLLYTNGFTLGMAMFMAMSVRQMQRSRALFEDTMDQLIAESDKRAQVMRRILTRLREYGERHQLPAEIFEDDDTPTLN